MLKSAADIAGFDIFLSHSSTDKNLIYGIYRELTETFNKDVYVDWLIDPQLDRTRVSIATADLLRKRIKQSKSLFYVETPHSVISKWMPWELGYMDGLKTKAAVMPLEDPETKKTYGIEYLGLYPLVDYYLKPPQLKKELCVVTEAGAHVYFDDWLGENP